MASVVFMQEAGPASQTLRFEDERLVVMQSDERSAREVQLAYLDVDLDGPAPPPPPRRGLLAALRRSGPTVQAAFGLFSPRRGAVEVWRDGQEDAIVGELKRRWREARRQAVRVNFAADPRREIARFETLLARGIVSAEECAAALARIAARASAEAAQ